MRSLPSDRECRSSDTQAKLDTIPDEPLRASDVMSRPVYTCPPDTNLAAVAKLMWHHDCGFVPVVGASGCVVGVITHGDIAIARETHRLLPELISAAQAMVVTIHSCLPDASVSDVLATMKRFRVRRLLVIDSHRWLQGVVSISDIVRAMTRGHSLNVMEVVSVMAAIGLSVPFAVTMKSPLADRDPVRAFRRHEPEPALLDPR
jgi:CBS domain-containing protein